MGMEIVSPTYGRIIEIKEKEKIITIYIDKNDIHTIYSPIDGKVEKIEFINGEFERENKIFKTFDLKVGRCIITINQITFWIEVGKPKYITDRVLLTIKEGEMVKKSDKIGEILLGSLSEIHLSKTEKIKVKLLDFVVGGKTVIATSSTDNPNKNDNNNNNKNEVYTTGYLGKFDKVKQIDFIKSFPETTDIEEMLDSITFESKNTKSSLLSSYYEIPKNLIQRLKFDKLDENSKPIGYGIKFFPVETDLNYGYNNCIPEFIINHALNKLGEAKICPHFIELCLITTARPQFANRMDLSFTYSELLKNKNDQDTLNDSYNNLSKIIKDIKNESTAIPFKKKQEEIRVELFGLSKKLSDLLYKLKDELVEIHSDFFDGVKKKSESEYKRRGLGFYRIVDISLISLLNSVRLLPYELNCILFQIAYSLYVANKWYDFVHGNLHEGNILIKKNEKLIAYCYKINGKTFKFKTKYLVKIIDFEFSMVSIDKVLPKEVIDKSFNVGKSLSGKDIDFNSNLNRNLNRNSNLNLNLNFNLKSFENYYNNNNRILTPLTKLGKLDYPNDSVEYKLPNIFTYFKEQNPRKKYIDIDKIKTNSKELFFNVSKDYDLSFLMEKLCNILGNFPKNRDILMKMKKEVQSRTLEDFLMNYLYNEFEPKPESHSYNEFINENIPEDYVCYEYKERKDVNFEKLTGYLYDFKNWENDWNSTEKFDYIVKKNYQNPTIYLPKTYSNLPESEKYKSIRGRILKRKFDGKSQLYSNGYLKNTDKTNQIDFIKLFPELNDIDQTCDSIIFESKKNDNLHSPYFKISKQLFKKLNLSYTDTNPETQYGMRIFKAEEFLNYGYNNFIPGLTINHALNKMKFCPHFEELCLATYTGEHYFNKMDVISLYMLLLQNMNEQDKYIKDYENENTNPKEREKLRIKLYSLSNDCFKLLYIHKDEKTELRSVFSDAKEIAKSEYKKRGLAIYCTADMSLFDLLSNEALLSYEFNCILFQIAYSLYVSDKWYDFIHGNLNVHNIMIKVYNDFKNYQYKIEEKTFKFKTKYLVKIINFECSIVSINKVLPKEVIDKSFNVGKNLDGNKINIPIDRKIFENYYCRNNKILTSIPYSGSLKKSIEDPKVYLPRVFSHNGSRTNKIGIDVKNSNYNNLLITVPDNYDLLCLVDSIKKESKKIGFNQYFLDEIMKEVKSRSLKDLLMNYLYRELNQKKIVSEDIFHYYTFKERKDSDFWNLDGYLYDLKNWESDWDGSERLNYIIKNNYANPTIHLPEKYKNSTEKEKYGVINGTTRKRKLTEEIGTEDSDTEYIESQNAENIESQNVD
jgi:hypothetical protein